MLMNSVLIEVCKDKNSEMGSDPWGENEEPNAMFV